MSYFTETFCIVLERLNKDNLHKNAMQGAKLSLLYGPAGAAIANKYPMELTYKSMDKEYHGKAAYDKWLSDQMRDKDYVNFYRNNVADSVGHQKKVRDYYNSHGIKSYHKEADKLVANMISKKDYNLNNYKVCWFDVNELKKALK